MSVGEWAHAQTRDASVQLRRDHDCVHVDGGWMYFTPAQWRKFAEQGNAIADGIQGRKALTLATKAGKRDEFAGLATGCFKFPDDMPQAEEWTDECWAHVAHVLRSLPGHGFGLLRDLWEQAGREVA